MKGRRVRLLTVAGVGATADVVTVAADIPVGALQPALAKLVGDWQLPHDDPRWMLSSANGTVLRPGVAARPGGALARSSTSVSANSPTFRDRYQGAAEMSSSRWQPAGTSPGSMPTPADRRFERHALEYPDPSPASRQRRGAGRYPRSTPQPGRMMVPAVALLIVAAFLSGFTVARGGARWWCGRPPTPFPLARR